MAWHIPFWHWLVQAAVGGLLLLSAGCLAARLCRQPVRRLRVIELTLLGCLLVPWLSLVSGLPQWSLGWLPAPEPVMEIPMARAVSRAGGFDEQQRLELAVLAERAKQQTADQAISTVQPPPSSEPSPAVPVAPQLADSGVRLSTPAFLLSGYIALSAGFLVWWLAGIVKLVRLVRSTYAVPENAAAVFGAIAGEGGRGVRLLASDCIDLPLTFTLRHPVIVLPGALCRSGDKQVLRYGLAHEWAHIQGRDIWSWHLATLAQILFFYQPLLWWLRRQLRLCQDYLADARAVEQAAVAEDYAEYLVGLARRRLGNPVPAALSIGDRRSNLYRRIIMLVNTPQPLERRCRRLWTLASAAGVVVLLAGVAVVRLDAGAPADDKKEPVKQESTKDIKVKGEPINYTGRVFDKDTGNGVPNAKVTVRRSTYGDPKNERVIEETKHTTNKEGKYSFTIPPEQAAERYLYIELDVEAPGFAPRSNFGYSFVMIQKNEKLGGRAFFENVDLRPATEITGIVETPEGKPAPGVKLLAYSNTSKNKENEFESGSITNAKTDKDGKFSIWIITPGPAVFWILPENHAPSTHVIKDPTKRGDMGRFVMSPGIVLKGTVFDAQGKVIPGVYVHANKRGGIEDFNLPVGDAIGRTALTDDKGEFTFAPLPAGNFEVMPEEQGHDPSKDDRRPQKRPVPGVFVRQHVTLKDGMGMAPEPIQVRAVPHVVIEAQYFNSKGKPTRGHAGHMFGRVNKNDFWFGQAQMDENGKMTTLAPHGLTEARLGLSTNEHGVLRWRRGKDGALQTKREVDLGQLTDDVKDIQIIRYVAPILILNAVEKGGSQIKDFKVKVTYAAGKSPRDPNSFFINGMQGDVFFEKQEDGRWRSSQMLPDEEVAVTISAEGYKSYETKLKLVEGTTKEIKAELDKSAEPVKKEAETK